ncbi:MAG: 3'(2'),5'-bisphosphate nucleotidase CysQ [Halioglobus sp.]|nr:3'(2'),5'-bisphosphate nucleotidase CysQ [Halioglobus sp.]
MQQLETLVAPLLALCREAGAAICAHYDAPGAQEYQAKGDDSPLTRADLASDRILQAGLPGVGPALPVLSEESVEAVAGQRRNWSRYWLVDPLDGTKEFLARNGEFTINIALIDDHRPVLGVLYLPLKAQAYIGIPGSLARRYACAGGDAWSSSDLHTRPLGEGQPLDVLASRRHRGKRLAACLDWLAARWPQIRRHNSGSALKFCQLAAGQGDFYPRFSRCCEWDTAAGQALLEAAGGALLGLDGRPLRYNCSDSLYSPDFFAIADPGHQLWRELLREYQDVD